jgi:hypothetical protein
MSYNLVESTLNHMGRRQFRSKGRGTLWASEASVEFTNEFNESQVTGKCKRSVWYRLKKVEPTNPPGAKSQMLFLFGNMIEDQVTEIWKQMGIWENNSVRWEDRRRNLSGEFDVILRNPDTNRLFGVEVKSFYGYHANKKILGHWSGRGANKRFIQGSPKDEHLMQAAIYADQAHNDLDGFMVVYVSRDNNQMQQFHIQVPDPVRKFILINGVQETRFTVNDIYNRYELLNSLANQNVPPTPDYTQFPSDMRVQQLFERGDIAKTAYEKHTSNKERYQDFHCSYCDFKDYCSGPLGDSPIVEENTEPAPDHMQHGGL